MSPVIFNEGAFKDAVDWLTADGAPADIAPDFVDGLLRYPRLHQLLEEAGRIKAVGGRAFTTDGKGQKWYLDGPHWEFVEVPA